MDQSILLKQHQRRQLRVEQDKKKMLMFMIVCFAALLAIIICNIILSNLRIISPDLSIGIYLGSILAAAIVISVVGFGFILRAQNSA